MLQRVGELQRAGVGPGLAPPGPRGGSGQLGAPQQGGNQQITTIIYLYYATLFIG